MISIRRKRASLGVGHDAFLDIVANLVGVIIILIAVFGGASAAVVQQAEQAAEQALSSPGSPTPANPQQLDLLDQLAARAVQAHHDSDQLERKISQFDAEISVRKRQRDLLLDLQAEATAAWQRKQSELNQDRLAAAKRHTELAKAEQQLAELRGEKQRLEQLPEAVIALQHLPTPMAKKAYEDRVVLRLRDDHVSVVPSEALMKAISNHVRRSTSGGGKPKATDVIGPIRGYTAHYSLVVGETAAIFHGAIFQPVSEPCGQPIAQVITGRSEIDAELAGRDPNRTSVLVWVYPDSYRALRTLKEYLYSKGYATAVRPRETHEPIGISVSGTESHVQ